MKPLQLLLASKHASRTILEILQGEMRLPHALAIRCLHERAVRLGGEACADPKRRVSAGQIVQVFVPSESEKQTSQPQKKNARPKPAVPNIPIVFADAHILVVDKPAGLTTVRHATEVADMGTRARKFLPPTLVDLLPNVITDKKGNERIRAVHRLDKETSGLIIFARTAEAETNLGLQFRAHSIERVYLALVRGLAQGETIESTINLDRGDGRRGSGSGGQRAVTNVEVVETFRMFSLVECRLDTGRTHQVRIHLGERGTPLCGETVYDRPLHGAPLPDSSGAQRPMLHAALLAVDHPVTRERMRWHSPVPTDMKKLLAKMRRG